jgi:hypothetical protein
MDGQDNSTWTNKEKQKRERRSINSVLEAMNGRKYMKESSVCLSLSAGYKATKTLPCGFQGLKISMLRAYFFQEVVPHPS